MTFLYHHVPDEMQGSVLYPLERLKVRDPALWARHVEKYKDRSGLLKSRIPILDCLWGEVLFFSPVHPQKICNALRKAGINKTIRCFEVPARLLCRNSAVMLPTLEDGRIFVSYAACSVNRYTEIPQHTIDYYRSCGGEMPLLYHGVPQILHRGTLNIAGLRIVEGR